MNLAFDITGRSTGPEMLLIHPWGANRTFWDSCVAHWAEDYRIIRCDLRGAGRSEPADCLWTADDHVEDLVRLRGLVGARSVLVIACAIGSLIAARYAVADSAHVEALVLCDTAPRLDEQSRARTQARLDLIDRDGIGALLPAVVDSAFVMQPRDERYRRYLEIFATNTAAGYGAIARGMMGTDNRDLLPRIACPTLVMAGEHDRLLPPSLAKEAQALIPGSEFEVIPGAAHFPPFQAPEAFCERVDAFIARRGVFRPA